MQIHLLSDDSIINCCNNTAKKTTQNLDEHILVSIYLAQSLQVADLAWALSTLGFPDGSVVKNLPANAGDTV